MSQKITSYPGHEITPEDVKERKYLDVVYKFEPRYSWAAGVAISRFLGELKEGRIIARKCMNCQRILVPPRMYCEQCFRPTDEWVQIKDTGTVNTYSISHVGTDARRLKTPILVAVVDLDGATPGMGILHNLGEVEPSRIKIGMKVKAVWKSSSERQGAITDIRYFKPVGDE
jgi:uncharacterized protein